MGKDTKRVSWSFRFVFGPWEFSVVAKGRYSEDEDDSWGR